MKYKKCTKCLKHKKVSNFYQRKERNSFTSHCKKCSYERCKKYNYKYKISDPIRRQKHFDNCKKYKASLKAWLDTYRDGPCFDCKNIFPTVCMDFDHIPGKGKKKFNICSEFSIYSKDEILKEIQKCELVCSNCHRIRTNNRLHPVT